MRSGGGAGAPLLLAASLRLLVPGPLECWALSTEVAARVGLGSQLLEDDLAGATALGGGAGTAEGDDDGYLAVARAALREEGGGGGGGLSEEAWRRIVASRVRAARTQHRVMKQFMRDFSRNLKLSVLEDSKGDIPENERLAMIRKLKSGEDIKVAPRKRAEDIQWEPPPASPPHHRPRMLNAGHRHPAAPAADAGAAEAAAPPVLAQARRPAQPLPAGAGGAEAEQGAEEEEAPGAFEADERDRRAGSLLSRQYERRGLQSFGEDSMLPPPPRGERGYDLEERGPPPMPREEDGQEEEEEGADPRGPEGYEGPPRRRPPAFAECDTPECLEAAGLPIGDSPWPGRRAPRPKPPPPLLFGDAGPAHETPGSFGWPLARSGAARPCGAGPLLAAALAAAAAARLVPVAS